MKQWLFDFTSFFFPKYCPVCGMPLQHNWEVICFSCERKMPFTRFADDPENEVAKIFWGRCELSGATSLFRFEKGSHYQVLLHLLKYKGRKDIGRFLGKLLAEDLINTPFSDIDGIIPVPLHPKKEKKRGYNQSKIIAEGMTALLPLPVRTDILQRIEHTSSQTQKNRFERWENMEGVFSLNESEDLPHKGKFLLVDDVVTTGATLEACINELKKLGDVEVFVATIAYA